MQTSKGVMYYVNDEYYIPMAIHSIKSLNNVSQLPISVYTSFVKDFSKKDNNLKNVDIIKIPEEPIKISQDAKTKFNSAAWRGKLKAYFKLPYDTTLFLDADIIILDSLQEFFESPLVLSPHYYPLNLNIFPAIVLIDLGLYLV